MSKDKGKHHNGHNPAEREELIAGYDFLVESGHNHESFPRPAASAGALQDMQSGNLPDPEKPSGKMG
jgi:hypothetical protein